MNKKVCTSCVCSKEKQLGSDCLEQKLFLSTKILKIYSNWGIDTTLKAIDRLPAVVNKSFLQC